MDKIGILLPVTINSSSNRMPVEAIIMGVTIKIGYSVFYIRIILCNHHEYIGDIFIIIQYAADIWFYPFGAM